MKITHINAENFLGIQSAAVALKKPVTLFAGSNFAGKSSLQEAVRMALTGETVRVSLKKEFGSLVTDGRKQGFVQVVMHDGTAESSSTIVLPSGKASAENYTAPPALPYVLDAQRFARLDEKERRAFLFGLMGLKTDLDNVTKRLEARGLDGTKVQRIRPMLRAGFDVASKDAKTKATEAKGSWRQLTGETYGAVKAETWEAARPDYDADALQRQVNALEQIDREIAAANENVGALQADKHRADEQQLRLSTLRAQTANLSRIKDKLALDEAQLAEWTAKVDNLQQGIRPQNVISCPCCKAKLVFNGRELEAASEIEPPADAEKLPEFIGTRDMLQRAVDAGKRDLAQAEKAAEEIKAVTQALGEPPTAEALLTAKGKVVELQQKRDSQSSALQSLRRDAEAAKAAETVTRDALAAHKDVAEWDAIGDALAPDGIPGEILAEALTPINERLAQSALDAEWPVVEIDRDMGITAGGRSYRLLSESEKWRVDAMVAEAISFQSGLKLVVLDRFDVLDAKGRTDLLAWLDVLATNKEIDTALVSGTLKTIPAELPASVEGQWISNGRVGQLKEAA